MKLVPYRYRNAPISGGGYVTGLLFHPKARGIAYARTDIGGVYAYRMETDAWVPLAAGVTHPGRWETYPLSIAVSPLDPAALFVAAGDGEQNNRLCVSLDYGNTFTCREIPTGVHGNAPGRGTGERLLCSPTKPQTLYFASQTGGLLITEDTGETWRKLPVRTCVGQEETNLTFVACHPRNEKVLLVGTNGEGNHSADNVRGLSMYVSRDGGAHFTVLPGQPVPITHLACTHPGYVAQRCAFDDRYCYIAYLAPSNCWAGFASCATDTGACFDGALMRYTLTSEGKVTQVVDLTPRGYADPLCPERRLGCGLAGLCTVAEHPGMVLLTTVCHPEADTLYLSTDYGEHFTPILRGLDTGDVDFSVPYMKPRYNGGRSILHWMSDVAVDPFNANRAMVNSGTGIFATDHLLDALNRKTVRWKPLCDGLEETVHLNVYSPAVGPVHLLDMVGDLGGFAFRALDAPCENSFADAAGNRYITCMNADYPEATTAPIAITARGNWTGKTTGGLIVSDDFGESWQRLPDPEGLSPLIDQLLADIRKPNVNAGWTAVAADGGTIVWGLAWGNDLPAAALACTDSRGKRWHACRVFDRYGAPVAGETARLKVFADRVRAELFYGFGDGGRLYVSRDRARTFWEYAAPEGFPACDLSGIDSRQDFEIRVSPSQSGVIWLALAENGLWRLAVPDGDVMAGRRISVQGDTVYRVGLGKPAPSHSEPTLYINAILGGVYGVYRSTDGGRRYERINSDAQMYGDIRSIAGDPRVFGRCYIATGTMGVLYGEPEA